MLKLDNNNGVCKGYKLRFRSTKVLDIYKEEGYFMKQNIDKFNKLTDLNYYSWYLECDRNYAIQILDKILNNDEININKTVFMIRSDSNSSKYVISFKLNTKSSSLLDCQQVKHINIEMINNNGLFELHKSNKYFVKIINQANNNNNNNKQKLQENNTNSFNLYTIENHRYFLSIVDLVNFFTENPFLESNKLAIAYRDALDTPLYVTLANKDFESKYIIIAYFYFCQKLKNLNKQRFSSSYFSMDCLKLFEIQIFLSQINFL
jgi:hypothetical protein